MARIQEEFHNDLLNPKRPNVYIVQGQLLRPKNLDNTTSTFPYLKNLIKTHGRYFATDKHIFFQSIIHIADFSDLISPIESATEYYGVIFLSNIPNGTEVYFKPRPDERLQGPYPWFRGNITLPIDKLMEVGDEMISYPQIGRGIREFIDNFDSFHFSLVNSGEIRSESSLYFDVRYRTQYFPKTESLLESPDVKYSALVRQDTSTPFGR